jgi:hypothetical protein
VFVLYAILTVCVPATVLGAETRGFGNITRGENSVDTVSINGKTSSSNGVGDDGLNGSIAETLALGVVVVVGSAEGDGSANSVASVIMVSLFNVPPGGSANSSNEGVDNSLLCSAPGTVENRVD